MKLDLGESEATVTFNPRVVDVEATVRTERENVQWTPTRPIVLRTSNFPLPRPDTLRQVHSMKGLLGIFQVPKEGGFDAWLVSSVALDGSSNVDPTWHEAILRRTEHLFKMTWAPPIRIQLWWRNDSTTLRTMANHISTKALSSLYDHFGHPLQEAAWLARGLRPRRTMVAIRHHPELLQLWSQL